MKKFYGLLLFFIVVLTFGTLFLVYIIRAKNLQVVFPLQRKIKPTYQYLGLHERPGRVANVFGWGFNRSSCYLSESNQTIQFFYAEDGKLYYGLSNNMADYHPVPFGFTVNPDFDVHCLAGSNLAVSVSDLDQNIIVYSEFVVHNGKLEMQDSRLAYNGGSYRSAVAPMSRILNNKRFISLMTLGWNDKKSMSTASVTWTNWEKEKPFEENTWKHQTMFEIDPSISQLMGISIENYFDTLIAILVHPKGDVYFSFYDQQQDLWTAPKKQQFQIAGHLEWQTLANDDGVSVIYRNPEQKLAYAHIGDEQTDIQVFDFLSINAFSIFENDKHHIFIMYNSGDVLQLTPSFHQIIEKTNDEQMLYFLQTPAQINQQLFRAWISGNETDFKIHYDQISIEDSDIVGHSTQQVSSIKIEK